MDGGKNQYSSSLIVSGRLIRVPMTTKRMIAIMIVAAITLETINSLRSKTTTTYNER